MPADPSWCAAPTLRIEGYGRHDVDLIATLPPALALGAAVIVGATIVGYVHARVPGWLHGLQCGGLAGLFALGTWLPIAAALGTSRRHLTEAQLARLTDATSLPLVLGPPIVVAVALGVVGAVRPSLLARTRSPLLLMAGFMAAVAVLTRLDASHAAQARYAQLAPLLVATGVVACATLVAVVLANVARTRALAHRFAAITHEGTVVSVDSLGAVLAHVETAGWLRAPRVVAQRCWVVAPTWRTDVLVGTELALPLPLLSTRLGVGQGVAVLRAGERVTLAGFVPAAATDGHPFRAMPLLTPGARGTVLRRADEPAPGAIADLLLAQWRPCVAYLLVTSVVAIVALAGM